MPFCARCPHRLPGWVYNTRLPSPCKNQRCRLSVAGQTTLPVACRSRVAILQIRNKTSVGRNQSLVASAHSYASRAVGSGRNYRHQAFRPPECRRQIGRHGRHQRALAFQHPAAFTPSGADTSRWSGLTVRIGQEHRWSESAGIFGDHEPWPCSRSFVERPRRRSCCSIRRPSRYETQRQKKRPPLRGILIEWRTAFLPGSTTRNWPDHRHVADPAPLSAARSGAIFEARQLSAPLSLA